MPIRSCLGSVLLDNNTATLFTAHNHDADAGKVKKKLLMSRIKETGINSNASVGNILDGAVGKGLTVPEVVHALPNFKRPRNFIYKSKNPYGKFNPVIDDIPDHLKKEKLDRVFLRYDSGVDVDKRFLLFIHEDRLLRFSNPEILVIDATFRTVPPSLLSTTCCSGGFPGSMLSFCLCSCDK